MKLGPAFTLTALAAALSSSPAIAAYNGFYFGLEGGYESNGSAAPAIRLEAPEPAGSLSQERRGGSGPAYGLFMGYAFELSERWFLGIEGGASLSHAGFKFVDLDEAGAPIEGQGLRVAMKQSFSLSAQLGYMLTDRLGVYGRLGLPGAKISYKSLDGGTIDSDSSYFSSYLAGGGLQYALGQHLFTRLEYTYSNLEVGPFGALDGRHRVMLGIGLGY